MNIFTIFAYLFTPDGAILNAKLDSTVPTPKPQVILESPKESVPVPQVIPKGPKEVYCKCLR